MAEHKVYAVLLLTHHANKPLPMFFRAATILIPIKKVFQENSRMLE